MVHDYLVVLKMCKVFIQVLWMKRDKCTFSSLLIGSDKILMRVDYTVSMANYKMVNMSAVHFLLAQAAFLSIQAPDVLLTSVAHEWLLLASM